jgi:hypothetical protein
MRNPVVWLMAAIAILALPPAAGAEDSARYTMSPVEGGMLRLDSQTGAVSICRQQEGGDWSCAAVPDSQLALQREIDELEAENASLRAELEKIKSAGGGEQGTATDKKQDRLPRGSERHLPSDETIDELMTVLEKMVRRFQDMIDSLKEQPPESRPGEKHL